MANSRKAPDSGTSRAKRPVPRGDPTMESAADAPHGFRPEQVYALVRDLILRGSLAPGSRIIETEIAGRLSVSRTPVREALQRLQQEGFVVGTPGAQQSRLTVAPLTRVDVNELLNIVGALEGLGAFEAARLGEEHRRRLGQELRDLNAEFHRAGRTPSIEHSALYDADERFHRRIVGANGGPRLLALHEAVKPQAERYIHMYINLLSSDVGASAAEHDAITEAIEQGHATEAQQAIQTNWRHAAERLSRVIDVAGERGSW